MTKAILAYCVLIASAFGMETYNCGGQSSPVAGLVVVGVVDNVVVIKSAKTIDAVKAEFLELFHNNKVTNIIAFRIEDNADMAKCVQLAAAIMASVDATERVYPDLVSSDKNIRETFSSSVVGLYVGKRK